MGALKDYLTARNQACLAESILDEAVCVALGVYNVGEWWWDDITYDEVDWDGVSVAFSGVKELYIPTPEQLEALWALGFTVIRIFLEGGKSGSGDWWQVKGRQPKECDHYGKGKPG